ncbi:hypothetical protein DDT91_06090 [Algoriphagus sp. AK58]|nr:hypothetical protein [Algoriphagus sp. AK58]
MKLRAILKFDPYRGPNDDFNSEENRKIFISVNSKRQILQVRMEVSLIPILIHLSPSWVVFCKIISASQPPIVKSAVKKELFEPSQFYYEILAVINSSAPLR